MPVFEFYQVSDIVPTRIITACTVNCREDCRLSAKITGKTLLGTSRHYTKSGDLVVKDDNRISADVTCSTCWRSWEVRGGAENTVATEIQEK